MHKLRISLLTNMVTPYRRPFFDALAAHDEVAGLSVLTCTDREIDRGWQVCDASAAYRHKILVGPTLNFRRGPMGWRILHFKWGVLWELVAHRPDRLVIGDASWTSFIAACAARFLRIPYVVWSEITTSSAVGQGVAEWMRRRMYAGAKAYVVSGELARDFLLSRDCRADSIFVARNAVDNAIYIQMRNRHAPQRRAIRQEIGALDEDFVLLYVGQLVARKRILETWDAVACCAVRIKLVVAGDGPLRSELLARVEASGMKDRFHHAGPLGVDELCRLYVAADGLVLASDDEPWGMVINEAILFALPFISTNKVGAAVELHDMGGTVLGDVSELQAVLPRFVSRSAPAVDLQRLPSGESMARDFMKALT